MSAKQLNYYKGRRKKRSMAIIPTVLILLFFGVAVVLFYSTQKYAVITDSGVNVELPFLGKTVSTQTGEEQTAAEFEIVDANLDFGEADYSGVEAKAGAGVRPVRAIYVPYEDINEEGITEYARRLSSGNALLLDLKQPNGYLAWYSDAPLAYSYGLNMAAPDSKQQLMDIIAPLKEEKIYLIAQISVCRDDLLGAHSTEVNIKNELGMYYFDEFGYWLDPYSTIVRDYAVQLVEELWDMGFDEVVLQDLSHPVLPEIDNGDGTFTAISVTYTKAMSTTPTPVGGISGFAVYLSEQLSDRPSGKYLSVFLNSSSALVKADKANGQDGELFMKVFDRIYYATDKYAYTFNVSDITPFCTVGSVKNRFVPVVINYLPENTSWVLVDQEE